MISINTKLVGLLGTPLGFTFSPLMHNQTFSCLDLDYYYIPHEVGKEKLEDVVKGIKNMNYAGFNVTKPNKVRILRYLDEVDDLAAKIGSVNTVKVVDGKLIGYNTDGEGYVASLKEELDFDPKGKSFTLLGAGGAGRAIAFTLAFHGAAEIFIIDRAVNCAEIVASELNANVCHCAQVVQLSDENLKECIDKSDVIINASGIGMIPHVDKTPFSKDLLNSSIIVSDITYNPLKTKLLQEAEEVGCRTLNGIGMMIHQGAKAFEIWTGVKAPVNEMTNIVVDIVKERANTK